MRSLGILMVLLAVLLMPFGMAPVHATAQHSPVAGMPMEHCPDNAPKHENKGSFAECTMACSAALPALFVEQERLQIVHDLVEPSRELPLHGLHPDTSTPPPKRS